MLSVPVSGITDEQDNRVLALLFIYTDSDKPIRYVYLDKYNNKIRNIICDKDTKFYGD